jgi:hypothetical protein
VVVVVIELVVIVVDELVEVEVVVGPAWFVPQLLMINNGIIISNRKVIIINLFIGDIITYLFTSC